MSDELDQASELEMLNTQIALANRPRVTATFTGQCHWCEEPIAKGHYCDAECRSDHEKYVRAQSHRSVA